MGARLRSIVRNPRLLLACKGIAFSALLWAHAVAPGWLSGVFFIGGAVFLYATPLFNASSVFSLFIAEIIISFALLPVAPAFRAAVIVLLGVAFAITVGLKNLVLTHREEWVCGLCCALSYTIIFIFFLWHGNGPFWFVWLVAMSALGLIWSVMIRDGHVVGLALVLFGEMIWVVSWLPIGFFASANMVFLAMLFMGDIILKKKITGKDMALFAVFIVIILVSSYWKL